MKIHYMPQGTPEWHEIRSGKITGTSLAAIMGSATVRNTLKLKILADRMAQVVREDFANAAMEHGTNTEEKARLTACKALDLNFETVGFIESDDIANFGMSPDGVVKDGDTVNGGIEIKCPNSTKHIATLLANEIPKEHKYQVYCPFVLSDDVEFWYFMSYDDRVYSRPEFYVRVDRADILDEIDACRKAVVNFIKDVDKTHEKLIGW